MSTLPDDIIIDILMRLPVKSILRFKCVCRSWLYLFDDIQFRKKHHHNRIVQKKNRPIKIISGMGNQLYAIDAYNSGILSGADKIDYPFYDIKYQKFDGTLGVLGSCNGLVCIRPRFDLICFWNPSTKEHKIMSDVELYDGFSWCKYGFGYDVKTQDYKFVRFECCLDKSLGTKIKVYSLASDSWSTSLCNMPYTLSSEARPTAVYLNGALHWLTDDSKTLISFDLGDEIIREVPGPTRNNFFDDDTYEYKFVDVLGGLLFITCIRPGVRGDVWVMKDYGVRESWTEIFSVPQRAMKFVHFTPVGYLQSGDGILLSVRLHDSYTNVLVCYNPKRKRARISKIHGSNPNWYHAYTYEESLFSVLPKQNSVGIRHNLDEDQVEQEEALSKHDCKRRKITK